jgi:hypothetical protein
MDPGVRRDDAWDDDDTSKKGRIIDPAFCVIAIR